MDYVFVNCLIQIYIQDELKIWSSSFNFLFNTFYEIQCVF